MKKNSFKIITPYKLRLKIIALAFFSFLDDNRLAKFVKFAYCTKKKL